ncbi:MMPL family transporter [Christiangramia sp. OXR-203]|jgi:predicted exporter|uniref:MMPL family transporter n=1 Tax=Christiangramia sp. OXR-203 TaxID=3100176 RepID=UPI002AC9E7DB|nr:MMPL family transporter [Christiangramia sp. OXR-203]WPY97099.1 MMPL family transporter [Christiangramia sp. OXR-203]
MSKLFLKLYQFLDGHKGLALTIAVLYLGLMSFLATGIQLEEDITKLVPSGNDQDLLKTILEESKFSDKIIFRVKAEENTDRDSLVSYANEISEFLNSELSEHVAGVKGKIPEQDIKQIYNFVQSNLPIFLNEQDYAIIDHKIEADSIAASIESGYKQLISPTGFVTKNYFLSDPLNITSLGLARLQELQVGDQYVLYQNYIMTKDQKNILFFIDPVYPASESNRNKEFTSKLEAKIASLNARYDTITGDYFGGLRYSVANAEQIKQDIRTTVMIAITVLIILLVVYYRKFYVPILLFLPSIFAGITAVAILYILQGSVSAISLGIGAILLGITLDYSLHILTHLRNSSDIEKLYKDISKPVIMSSLTTAIAFMCLVLVKSEALHDLGIFASLSVLFSSFFALVLIPFLYKPEILSRKTTFLDRISSLDYSRIKPLVYLLSGLFVVSLFFFSKVEFNEDLSELNFQPEHIKKVELELEGLAGRSGKTILLVAYGNSLDEALYRNNQLYQDLKRFENEGDIENFSSIGGVVLSTETQESRIEQWNSFWTPEKQDLVKNNIQKISESFGFKSNSFSNFDQVLDKNYSSIGLKDYELAGSLYMQDFVSHNSEISTVSSSVNLPADKVERFISYFENVPGVVALDRKAINQNFLGDLKADFNILILASVVAVFLVLLVFYQNLLLSVITLLPIAITWICALGIMYFFRIEFNILNIIISSFIFGLGLDYSIFITNSCLKEYETGKSELKTYQASIILSVITTLLGIGALIFAKHPALRSISIVSIIGVLTAVSVSFILQRSLFRKLIFQQFGSLSFRRNKKNFISEKLYHKEAILKHYRYHTTYSEAKAEFRQQREKFLKISRYLAEVDDILVLNSGIGILPLFIKIKYPQTEVYSLELDESKRVAARNAYRLRNDKIHILESAQELPLLNNYIIQGDIQDSSLLKDLSKSAEMMVFLDSEMKTRWLLDQNFELTYRQNDILIYRKLT